MSLKNICFENIKDEFYYGKFGEFTLVIDKNTGFFNATKLCKQSKKNYSDWIKNKRTKVLLEEINILRPENSQGGELFSEIKTQNKSKQDKIISGTYLCKELILDLASWISPEFYLKCNDIILNYFEREYQSTLKEKDDKIDILLKKVETVELQNNNLLLEVKETRNQNTQTLKRLEAMGITLEETREQNDEILEELQVTREQNEDIIEELQETNEKLDRVLPDRNIDPQNNNLKHSYILFKNKLIDNEYMFVKGQDKYIKNKKNAYKTEFEITLEQTKNPNPIDLINRLKEKIQNINKMYYLNEIDNLKVTEDYLTSSPVNKRTQIMRLKKKNAMIVYRANKIVLQNNYSEEDFLRLISMLDNEKYNV